MCLNLLLIPTLEMEKSQYDKRHRDFQTSSSSIDEPASKYSKRQATEVEAQYEEIVANYGLRHIAPFNPAISSDPWKAQLKLLEMCKAETDPLKIKELRLVWIVLVYENEKTLAESDLRKGFIDNEEYNAALWGALDCMEARMKHHDVVLPELEAEEEEEA